jgi:hypothetical protein
VITRRLFIGSSLGLGLTAKVRGQQDDTALLQAELDATGRLGLGAREYILTRPLVLPAGALIVGCGNKRSILRPYGPIGALVCSPSSMTEGPLQLRDFGIVGSSASTDLITIRNVAGVECSGLWLRNSARSGLLVCGPTYNLRVRDCRIEDCAYFGIGLMGDAVNAVSVWSITNCDVNTNATNGLVGLYVVRSAYGEIRSCNFEGSDRVLFGVRFIGAVGVTMENSYVERYTTASVAFDDLPSSYITVARNHLHPRVDVNAERLAHVDVRIEQNRLP